MRGIRAAAAVMLAAAIVAALPGSPRAESPSLTAAAAPAPMEREVPREGPATPTETMLEETYDVRILHVPVDPCGKSLWGGRVLGCHRAPNGHVTITVTARPAMYESETGLYAIDQLMRHEVAHTLIMRNCGTTHPPIAGDRWENVTDAYAVWYLFADLDVFNEHSGYGPILDRDLALAQQIHDGDCG